MRRAWGRRSRTSPVGSGRTRRGTGICMPACPDPRPWLRTNDSSLAVGYGGDCWMDRWPWRRWPSFSLPISLSRLPWIIQCINDPLQCKQRQGHVPGNGSHRLRRPAMWRPRGHGTPGYLALPAAARDPALQLSKGRLQPACSARSPHAGRESGRRIPSAWIRIHHLLLVPLYLLPAFFTVV